MVERSAGGVCLLLGDLRLEVLLFFPIPCMPDGLEKVLSSHPSGWALLRCLKPSAQRGNGGGGDAMVPEDVLLPGPVLVLPPSHCLGRISF